VVAGLIVKPFSPAVNIPSGEPGRAHIVGFNQSATGEASGGSGHTVRGQLPVLGHQSPERCRASRSAGGHCEGCGGLR